MSLLPVLLDGRLGLVEPPHGAVGHGEVARLGVVALVRVPPVSAVPPRQVRDGDEAVDQVEERPGDDDAVVYVEEEDEGHGGVADALEHGHELADEGGAARAEVLAGGHLLEEDGDAAGEHRDEVDEQEGAWRKEKEGNLNVCRNKTHFVRN